MSTTTTPASEIQAAALTRSRGHEEARALETTSNRKFVDLVRELIASNQISVGDAAKAAGVSRQVMHDLLRRFPA